MCSRLRFSGNREPSFSSLSLVWSDLETGPKLALCLLRGLFYIVDHFYQFGTISGGAKSRRSLMHLFRVACVWVIWKERNDMIFSGKENYPLQLLEKVKLLSFWWFKAHTVFFHYSFHNWCQNPFTCVGCG